MNKASGTRVFGKAIGVALAIGGSHAWAQEAAPTPADANPPVPPQQKATATQLGKVVVDADDLQPTSPKFTAPLVDTPMSVTILPQSVMQETAATSLQDALRNVPGITFAAGEGGTPTGDLPSIRGFNSSGSIYVDGMRDIGVQTRDIFDLEQVEVIKGPDSSIAGRSAGGGAINLVTKTAQADDFLDATSTYGSAGQYREALDGNYRITDQIAARLNFMDMGGGVPGRNSAVRTDKLGVAPTITFGLQSPTRLILNYYHYEDKSTPDYGIPVDYDTGQPVAVNPENFYGLADRDFRRNPVDTGEARLEHDFGDAWTLRTQARYTTSLNNYLLTLPYLATGANYALVQPLGQIYRLPIGNVDRTRSAISQTDLSGHFDTGSIHHDVDVGFEASREKERLGGGDSWEGYNVTSSAGPQGFSGGTCSTALLASYDCTSLYNPNPNDPWTGSIVPATNYAYFTTDDVAPYAFDTITLSPHWKINGGLRWDLYHSQASDPSDPTEWGGPDNQSFTSYQLGLMYKPVSDGTIYLSSSSAAIPNDQAATNSQQDEAYAGTTNLKPEVTRTLELGTKWNLFSDRLLLSGDVFEEKQTNSLIYITADSEAPAGEEEVKGVEVSANGSITRNWNMIAGFSHLDAIIESGGLYGEAGQHVPNTPPDTFSLWSTYRVAAPVTVGGGAYYQDKQIGYAGPPDDYIDGYWRFDAMGKWQIDRNLALQLNVQNLFNKFYYAKSFYWYALPAAGRTWMVTADYKL